MNMKRLVGIAAALVGIFLIFYALHAMQEIRHAKESIDSIQDIFSKSSDFWNRVITFFGGKAKGKASSYDLPALLTLIAGIAFTLSGTVLAVMAKTKKEKKR